MPGLCADMSEAVYDPLEVSMPFTGTQAATCTTDVYNTLKSAVANTCFDDFTPQSSLSPIIPLPRSELVTVKTEVGCCKMVV